MCWRFHSARLMIVYASAWDSPLRLIPSGWHSMRRSSIFSPVSSLTESGTESHQVSVAAMSTAHSAALMRSSSSMTEFSKSSSSVLSVRDSSLNGPPSRFAGSVGKRPSCRSARQPCKPKRMSRLALASRNVQRLPLHCSSPEAARRGIAISLTAFASPREGCREG